MSNWFRSLTGGDVAAEYDGFYDEPKPRRHTQDSTRDGQHQSRSHHDDSSRHRDDYRPHHATPDEYHDTHTAAEWHDIIKKVTPVYDKWLKQGYVFLHFVDEYGEDPHISEEFADWAPLLVRVLDMAPEEFLIEVEEPEPPVEVGEDDDLYDLFQFMSDKPKSTPKTK